MEQGLPARRNIQMLSQCRRCRIDKPGSLGLCKWGQGLAESQGVQALPQAPLLERRHPQFLTWGRVSAGQCVKCTAWLPVFNSEHDAASSPVVDQLWGQFVRRGGFRFLKKWAFQTVFEFLSEASRRAVQSGEFRFLTLQSVVQVLLSLEGKFCELCSYVWGQLCWFLYSQW